MLISLIIPTYNEAENITNIIKFVFSELENKGFDGEIILVDDDSPDGTWEIAEKLKTIYKIKVLRRLGKRGLSSAVIDGLKLASGDILGVMDADMSHPPEKIAELLEPIISNKSDIVIGSRYVEGGRIENWPLGRRLSSRIATLAVRGLTRVRDPMSGFLFFRKSVIEGIELSEKGGFKIGVQIIVKGNYKKITEIPIKFSDRRHGHSKLDFRVVLYDSLLISKLYLMRLLRKLVSLFFLIVSKICILTSKKLITAGMPALCCVTHSEIKCLRRFNNL